MDLPRTRTFRAAMLVCGLSLLQNPCPAQQPSQNTPSAAQTDRITPLLDTIRRVKTPQTAAISPDGNYVAWTVEGPAGWELHLTGIAPPSAIQDAAWDRILSPDSIGDVTNLRPGRCEADHPLWSPDGKQLAFLSACELDGDKFQKTKPKNIFLWALATNQMRQFTHLKGQLNSLQWSPDGKFIDFLFVENGTRRAGALDAMKPPSGVIGEDGVEIQRVFSVEIASGSGNWLTPEGLHVYEFEESPNSKQIAYVGANPPGENNWWTAKLYVAPTDQEVPFAPKVVFDPRSTGPLHGLQIAVPGFSPDGKQIAFIGGLMSDQGSTGGDIYLIPSAGGEPKDITSGRPASPAWIAWRSDHSLLVTERAAGKTHITALDTTTGKDDPAVNVVLPETIVAGADVMDLSLAAQSPNIAVIRSSFDRPPEVWTGPIGDLHQLTHLNDNIQRSWGKSESIQYTDEGLHVQGWLLYPADYDPAKRYPLIVSVHGGPSSSITPRWPSAGYGSVPFSALGYFVFMPNPRGSFGEGEKFTQANIKDFGYGDLRDILAGVDMLEKRFPIDTNREGITGWSYGGFMTMFAVTQTHRFKAAVAGAGISNWQSYYGENSIDQWMVPFFGATVYEDPAIYAKSSPINFLKNVTTPTLMVVGDRDGECPAPQSFEFWHALRELGIKTQLVVYPNEGHHFVDPEHQRDVLRRALEWFQTNMLADRK